MPIDFYNKLNKAKDVYTFRDFILLPGLSKIEPEDVSLSSNFSTDIKLNVPLVSSPMDTVTESEMAISMAREGGLGIIHRNMSIDKQVEEVKKVKRAESFIIKNLVTASPDLLISEATKIMSKHNVSGLPIVKSKKLVGLLTKRDVKFSDIDSKVSNLMTKTVVTASESVSIDEAKRIMHKNRVEKLPVVNNGNELIGLITVKDIYSREKYSLASRDDEGRLLVGASISPFDLKRAKALDDYVDVLVSDVAHFHNENILKAANKLSKEISSNFVVGNLGTKTSVEDVIHRIDKFDGIRAGVGSGSICITSEVTKAGSPTLFAVSQIASKLQEHNLSKPIIADGGIRSSGDAALAFAIGASSVMMGNVFAGCNESPGNLIKIGGKYYKQYRGMGSDSARAQNYIVDRYSKKGKTISEGVEGVVPSRGNVSELVKDFVGGLQASFGYAGAKDIKTLWQTSSLGQITGVGSDELKSHNIILPGEDKY